MKKWALALGGGGILGIAHIGVLLALEDIGLRPDIITGTSAGSVVAGLYACGVDLNRIADITSKAALEEDEVLDMRISLRALDAGETLRPLAFPGLIGGDLIEAAIDRVVKGARLADARVKLAVMSVDIISGSIIVFTNDPPSSRSSVEALGMAGRQYVSDAKMCEALRASFSIPGVFVPKKFGPWALVDGGIRDMVPVYEAKRMGADEVIAVDLSSHVERPQRATSAVSILSRSFALACRERTEKYLAENASVTLQPEVWEPGLPTPAKVRELVDQGREAVEGASARLLSILSRKK